MIDVDFAGSPPVNDSERRAYTTIVEELQSSPERFALITNIRLPRGQDFYEYDAIVVGEHMLFVVEVKGYGGRIICQRDRWYFEDGTAFENPSNPASVKAKNIGALLLGRERVLRGRLWVQDLVYVNGPGAKLSDTDYLNRTSYDVTGTSFDNAKALGSALRDAKRWCRPTKFSDAERNGILDYLRAGKPRVVEDRLGRFVIEESLVATSERYTRLLGRDRYRPPGDPNDRVELHVYPLDGRRDTVERANDAFARQLEVVEGLGSSGVAARYVAADEGTWHNRPVRYIAYEWLGRFETLGDRIASSAPMSLRDGLRLGIALADSIAVMHEQGIVHGALEPSSLFLRDGNPAAPRIAIGRIELARPRNAGMSVSASSAGPAASCYASPDVIANKHPDIDDDQFSFGAILAHVLRGRPLFAAPSEIIQQIRLPRLVEDRSSDPPNLHELVRGLLSRSPLSRPRSMRDVATRLRDILAQLDVRQREPSRLGPYRILRELRSGATGRTVVAERADLSGEVVLKVAPLGGDETLRHEVETLRALQQPRPHPHVVFAYDIHTLDADGVVVGEFGLIPGDDGERVRGKIPETALRPLIEGLFSGLAYVHERGLVHRDVKPANVMLGSDGKSTLLDFGLAANPGDDNIIVGTAPYKPELLFERKAWTAWEDVFAAVTTVWEIATARHPWAGEAPHGPPHLDAADLGLLLGSVQRGRFVETVRELLAADDQKAGAADRARERLLRSIGDEDARLELTLPRVVELVPDARLVDLVESVSLGRGTRRALDDLGVQTLEDVLLIENATLTSVRAYGRGATEEIAALRIAVAGRFGELDAASRSVLRSVQGPFAPALVASADAARENLDVLQLPAALAAALRSRGALTVAGVASLEPARLERDTEIGSAGVAAIRAALHDYDDDHERLVVEAALPPHAVAMLAEYEAAVRRIGGDPATAIDLLEQAGGFCLRPDELPLLEVPLAAAPPWTHADLTAAVERIADNADWPPVDLVELAVSVAIPPSLAPESRVLLVERLAPAIASLRATSEGRWYRSETPALADLIAYGAAELVLPAPLAAFVSALERRLPGVRLPSPGAAEFVSALGTAGFSILGHANVERTDAIQPARDVDHSVLEGIDPVSLSAAARSLVAATRTGGYRLVVAEPAIYARRVAALVAELRTAVPGRVRVVDVDAELCRRLREAGKLEMAVRVQARSGLRSDALGAIAGDIMRSILDGLLGGEAQSLTIAVNAGSLGLTGNANHIGAVYDAARGGRYGLVVVCVPGDHPSDHARLNRQIHLPIQPTERPLALEDVA